MKPRRLPASPRAARSTVAPIAPIALGLGTPRQPAAARERGLRAAPERRGAALMLSLLVLFVLVAIVFQLNIATNTDARVARNELVIAQMDMAIASSQLEVFEQLKSDADAGQDAGAGGAGGMPGAGGLPGASGAGNPFGGGGGGGGNPLGGGGGTSGSSSGGASDASGAGGAGGGQASGPTDSKMDEWARPQRTSINEIDLRVLIQDEESKYNVLAMLTANEDEAQKAFDRVVRILDMCREGTEADIDAQRATKMAESMREHMRKRADSVLPRSKLLTDVETDGKETEQGLPLSLREFAVLEGFQETDFRDFRDSQGRIVHSIGSFLTVWTCLTTRAELQAANGTAPDAPTGATSGNPTGGSGGNPLGGSSGKGNGLGGGGGGSGSGGGGTSGGGGGVNNTGAASSGGQLGGAGGGGASTATGIAVNVNTAPPTVLKALFDERDVPMRFWDEVIEYRNKEKEKDENTTDTTEAEPEPIYDEFGREIIERQFFESVDGLKELDSWPNLEPQTQAEIQQLLSVQSNVFTIFTTARKRASGDDTASAQSMDPKELMQAEEAGGYLSRTVACTVWRRAGADGTVLVPIQLWELIDYSPYEVVDFAEAD